MFILLMAVSAHLAIGGRYLGMLSGLLTGSSVSLFLFPVANYLVRKDSEDTAIIKNWGAYFLLLGIIFLFSGAIFFKSFLTFALLEITSVSGLGLLYLLLSALIIKRVGEILRKKPRATAG